MLGMKGKSIIVTGGGSGIGRATALILGEAGARVTMNVAVDGGQTAV
jgi:NAD(P)-dependent dehydrogenase (short-subunit alcohol dehydrogenase family)